MKKERPVHQKKCSEEYWMEIIAALGKYYKVDKEQVDKAKRSRIYLK